MQGLAYMHAIMYTMTRILLRSTGVRLHMHMRMRMRMVVRIPLRLCSRLRLHCALVRSLIDSYAEASTHVRQRVRG
jgi:hypothetical protein